MRVHIAVTLSIAVLAALVSPPATATGSAVSIPDASLHDGANVIRDSDGIVHIFARNEHDLIYLQGWVHARDRLFQMDHTRRQAEGTLAELLGSVQLASDVQLRTFGVRRAAERSLPLLSAETRAALQAYAAGVNAYVATHPLPPEYVQLELSSFRPWSETDSLTVLSATLYGQSFDLTDIERTNTLLRYRAAGAAQGFDPIALLLQDTNRIAPFDPATTVPRTDTASPLQLQATGAGMSIDSLAPGVGDLGSQYMQQLRELPSVLRSIRHGPSAGGSNAFALAGRWTLTGQPLLASDPHLALLTPAIFYENHLRAPGFDVIGASFPGVPYVANGHNDRIAWGTTTNPLDVTDVYQEQLTPNAAVPSGLSTLYRGGLEPVLALPQVFRVNVRNDGMLDSLVTVPAGNGVPARTLIVPRRNQGPIISINPATGLAFSVQYTGSSGGRTLDALRGFNRARGLDDFKQALQYVDGTGFNFLYADTSGNIAYLVGTELPLREDLQANALNGLPPFFVRNGQGGNEWLTATTADPQRALPFEVLPAAELPQLVNPPSGILINANNDPTGTTLDNDALNETRPAGGILYFGAGFDNGIRAGRIAELLTTQLATQRRLGVSDLQRIQSDVGLSDARFFTPFILQALANARRADAPDLLRSLAADVRIQEAVARLQAWDRSAPTGIAAGFDANDPAGRLRQPSAREISNSVATTLYTVWRNQIFEQTLLATLSRRNLPLSAPRAEVFTALRALFENFPVNQGRGASGIDFFSVPELSTAADRRDFIVLRSLGAALDKLAGPDFAAAFGGSTQQQDYRWGRLHRLVLAHPLGGNFSLPSTAGGFAPPLADLAGIPLDGGLFTVDLGDHVLLDDRSDGFMLAGGPNRRFVARVQAFGTGIEAVTSLPGGASGVLGTPFYSNLLPRWLTNDVVPLRQDLVELVIDAVENLRFVAAP